MSLYGFKTIMTLVQLKLDLIYSYNVLDGILMLHFDVCNAFIVKFMSIVCHFRQ